MTEFRLLPKPEYDGRIDDERYFRINSAMIVFAYQIGVYLALSEANYVTLYKSDDGFLSFSVGTRPSPNSYHVNCVNGGTKRPYYTCFIKKAIAAYGIQPGSRFHIVGSENKQMGHYTPTTKIFKTDCPVK